MLKKTLMAVGVAAAAGMVAAPAFAALTQTATSSVTYAEEIFGTGSDATVLTNGADVVLTTGAAIASGEKVNITYTLTNGATFGAAVTLADLTFTPSATGAVAISLLSDGAAGDTSVTFQVEVTAALANTDAFSLNITSIKAASILADNTKTVDVAVTIAAVTSGGVNLFPTTVATVTSGTVAASAAELTWTIANAVDATIDVANRSDITTGAVAITDGAATLDGVKVGDLTINDAAAAGVEADGATNLDWDASDLFTITVVGAFNTGDQVFVSADTTIDTGEPLTITGSTATGTITAADVAGLDVYYVANGTSTLAPTTFTLTVTSTFADATWAAQTGTDTATTSYSGLSADGWAMAIPGSTSADIANVRVTNETATAVTLFAQGYGQDGTDLGFQELTGLAANETQVLGADDLEAVFGTWSGRARFDFSSSGNISVETMMRSGGILNNMTGEAGTTVDANTGSDFSGSAAATANR